MRQFFSAAAAVLAAAVVGLLPAAGSAAVPANVARPLTEYDQFQNRGSGNCIEDTPNNGFRMFGCNRVSYAQRWRVNVADAGAGTYQIVNSLTGKCMYAYAAYLGTEDCQGYISEQWYLNVDSGYFVYQAQSYAGSQSGCLWANDTALALGACNVNDRNEQWIRSNFPG